MTGNTFFFPWEVSLMEQLQARLGNIQLISWFSAFGEELFLVLMLGFLYWAWDKRFARRMGLSLLTALLWHSMLKNVFLRRRPYFDHESIRILRPVEADADLYDVAAQGYSFPSGHTTNATGIFVSLGVWLKKRWMTVLAVLVPVLVAFSRVVVGAHYPTDVLVGALLGACTALIVPWMLDKVPDVRLQYLILLLATVPGVLFCRTEDYFTGIGLLVGFIIADVLERRYVHFENTRHPLRCALRVLGGVAIYVSLNTLLKLPFSREFLHNGTMASMLVRAGRYALIIIVEFAGYPLLFRAADRFWRKN